MKRNHLLVNHPGRGSLLYGVGSSCKLTAFDCIFSIPPGYTTLSFWHPYLFNVTDTKG